MLNIKKLSVVALLLLLVGVVGSVSTYKFTSKFEVVTEELEFKDDSFTKIEVSMNDAQVELIPTTEPDTLIEISGHDLKNNFSATVTKSTLSITNKESKQKLYNFDFVTKPTTLKVYIPKQHYDTVQIQSDNGSFSAENIDANEVNVKANDGTIELRNINAQTILTESDNGRINGESLIGTTVSARANDGRIHLKHVTANSVSIISDNGKIELEEIKGELSAKASDGQITLLTDTLNYPIEFSANNGRIDIQTNNAPTNATIHTQAVNGVMFTFGVRQSQPVVFGLGEHKINLTSNEGGIIVEYR